MKITLKRSLMAVLCVVGMSSFVACSDDDDPITPPVIEPTAENGSYTGTMSYESAEAPTPPLDKIVKAAISVPVTFEASQSSIGIDSIYFAKFPVKSLVESVVGVGNGDEIIEALGDVKYTVYYTAKAVADGMELTLTSKPLVLNLGKLGNVNVTVEAITGAKYVTASKKMTFTLKAANVAVGGVNLPEFQPITLSFDATKQ